MEFVDYKLIFIAPFLLSPARISLCLFIPPLSLLASYLPETKTKLMPQDLTTPVRQNERIRIIDTIRGIALLGILMMNMPYFANPAIQSDNLNVMNEYGGRNYYTWLTIGVFFEGTMRGLFSILFGAGCILLLNRLEHKKMDVTAADIYYRRLLWLFLFGMIN